MVGHPGVAAVEMGFDSQLCPSLEFFLNVGTRTFRLKSQRVSAKIHRGAAIGRRWNMKLLPKSRQWIAGVHLGGEAGGSLESDHSHLDSWQRRQPLLDQRVGLRPIDILEPLNRVAELFQHAVLNAAPLGRNRVRSPVKSYHRVLGHKSTRIFLFQFYLNFLPEQESRVGYAVAHLDEVLNGKVSDGVGIGFP